jgi:TRAP-type C4-dicarboxylate transport system permease small subunit
LSLLVIDVVWQVFTRYVLQSPSTFTDELARFLLIWLSLAGGAYYSGQNQHISINILPDRLSPSNRYRLNIISACIIMLFVFSVFVIGGSYLVYLTHTYRQITPALQIPMAWVYLIGPLSGLLILYYKLSDLLRLRTTPSDNASPQPGNL